MDQHDKELKIQKALTTPEGRLKFAKAMEQGVLKFRELLLTQEGQRKLVAMLPRPV